MGPRECGQRRAGVGKHWVQGWCSCQGPCGPAYKTSTTRLTPPHPKRTSFLSPLASVTTNETLLASPFLLLFLSSFPVYAHKSARHTGTCTPAQPRCACARAHTHWSGPITASLEQEPMRARLTHRTSEPHPHTERRPRRDQNPAKHPHFLDLKALNYKSGRWNGFVWHSYTTPEFHYGLLCVAI